MCEQCMAQTKTWGSPIPGWWLVEATKDGNMMKTGDFGLVKCNDPDYVWPGDLLPLKDPCFDFTDEQFDNMTEEEDKKWFAHLEYIDGFRKYFVSDPLTGYDLVVACIKAGYNRQEDGCVVEWLVHKMAVIMDRNPTADEAISNQNALEDWGTPK